MDLARACSTLLEKDQLRGPSNKAIQLILESITAENLPQLAGAIYASLTSKFDSVRTLAAEIIIENIQNFISQDFDSLFHHITSILETKNLPFDAYEKSELVREDCITAILKMIISIEKGTERDKSHSKYGEALVKVFCKQLADRTPNCRIQLSKAIFRFSRVFQQYLTETQVKEISEAIITNFNHNQKQIRQLNLQAFTQLHLANQSKDINRSLQQIFPLILSDSLITDTVADCMKTLLFNHIDRHIYADIFAIPLLSNLAEKYTFNIFLECGDFYVSETKKHDKFLLLQEEIENCVTGQETQFNAFIANFNKDQIPHFDSQLNLGCRVIAQQVLEKQLQAILKDLESVQKSTKVQATILLQNLIILSSNFTVKFGQKFANSLQFLLHDEFNDGEFDKLIQLMAVFCSPNDILNQVQRSISTQSAENSRFLSRIYRFLSKFLYFKRFSADISQVLNLEGVEAVLKIIGSNEYLFNEDYLLIASQLLCVVNLVQFLIENGDMLQQMCLESQSLIFVLVSAVYVKLNNQQLFTDKKHVLNEYLADARDQLFVSEINGIRDLFGEFFSIYQELLNFNSVQNTLHLNQEILKTDRIIIRCQIFAQFLNFSSSFNFATKNAQKAVNLAVKMLKISSDIERMNQEIRYECLECVKVLSKQINLRQDQLIFLINGVYSCTTWRHGARSPACLVKAIEILTILVTKQTEELQAAFPYVEADKCSEFGATVDQLVTRICLSVEDDWVVVREATLELCAQFLKYCLLFNIRPDELGLKLCYRLDDARENVTIEALTQLYQLIEICEKHAKLDQLYGKDQIIEMIITHCDDPNGKIRQKCINLGKSLMEREIFAQSGKDKAKNMNWQYLTEKDRSWLE